MVEIKIPQNVTDMVNKSIDEMAKATSQVLNDFLCEYCEVKGIKEEELREHLSLEYPTDSSVHIVENGRVLLRQSLATFREGKEKYYITCSFFLGEKNKYPKTLQKIQQLNKAC